MESPIRIQNDNGESGPAEGKPTAGELPPQIEMEFDLHGRLLEMHIRVPDSVGMVPVSSEVLMACNCMR